MADELKKTSEKIDGTINKANEKVSNTFNKAKDKATSISNSVTEKKKKVMGKIAALNKLAEGKRPRKKKKEIDRTVNKENKIVKFITDLMPMLMDINEILDTVVDTLNKDLPKIEDAVKTELRSNLKEIVSCGIDPSIPDWFKSTGSGIDLELKKIDFFHLMNSNPASAGGKLLYEDISSKQNSVDYNTFLYYVIDANKNVTSNNGGTHYPWGNSTIQKDFMDVSFSPIGLINNETKTNIINFKVNSNFDNKTLTDVNNYLVDSFDIFGQSGASKVFTKVMDSIFGVVNLINDPSKTNVARAASSIGSTLTQYDAIDRANSKNFSIKVDTSMFGNMFGKTNEQLTNEAKVEEVIECILNSEGDVPDSAFKFSNETISRLEAEVANKKSGIKVLDCCKASPIQFDPNVFVEAERVIREADEEAKANPKSTVSPDAKKSEAMKKALNNVSNHQASFATASVDIPAIKLNFITDFINNLTKSLVTFVVSPKLITIYAINHKIVYGQNTQYENAVDFINKNKNMVKRVADTILEIIIKALLKIVLIKIRKKISQLLIENEAEKIKDFMNQLSAVIGLPPMVNQMINRL